LHGVFTQVVSICENYSRSISCAVHIEADNVPLLLVLQQYPNLE
jgi:hypothetical protein